MDYRFPKWLRTVVKKLDFLAIPNIGPILAACAVIGFFAVRMNSFGTSQVMFDPRLIMEGGQWWRILAFPFMSGVMMDSLFFLLFHCLYIYYVCSLLESHWGTGPLSVYLIFSYICTIAASLFFPSNLNLSHYVMENISLVVGTLLPDIEFTLYFLLPVKAKWLAFLSAALIVVSAVNYPSTDFRISLLIAFFPYFLFFGPLLFTRGKDIWKRRKNRQKFNRNTWN